MTRFSQCFFLVALQVISAWSSNLLAQGQVQPPAGYVPQPGQFPPAGTGTYFAGELVMIDPINRRGGLRLDGDGVDDRYHRALPLRFAMLPYGNIRYHGAPAELRDVPIGTHLHGTFYLPPAGDVSIPKAEGDGANYVPPQNHAILLEDDFSFYQRQGQAWKIVSIELTYDSNSPSFPPRNANGDWRKTVATGKLKVASIGQAARDGRSGEMSVDIDRSTRIWKGREFAEIEDLIPEAAWVLKDNKRTAKSEVLDQAIQLNLTWAPDWLNGNMQVADLWFDKESRDVAIERQRRTHIRYQQHHWLAGWIDHVDHQEGGKGIVTVTLFGGMDPVLYDQARAQAKVGGASIAAAEKTLRTWWQEHDSKNGAVLDYKDSPNPPLGSSGLQLRVQINELLEGYRPGRIVRFRPNGWPNVKLPPEERVKTLDDQ